VLSKERRASIEAYHEASFSWERRRERLWDVVRGANADVVTLAECDCFDSFWKPKFDSAAYGVVWRKRPRPSSPDGCAIAWRNSTFELLGVGGFDFGSSLDRLPDRTCLFALLRWRRDPNQRLLVATAHLARMATSVAESADQLLARGFQYGVLFRELLQFAASHQAEDVPVVLTGDLNAKDCDELAGIARALVRLLSSPTHPLLWSIMDAPTPPTTVTEERALRIDYLLYQSAALTLVGVTQLPRLTSPIPDSQHPSDHLPIAARLVVRPRWQRVEEDARQWCACISGTNSVRPLSGEALRDAFSYFDKDGSSRVSLIQLETGLQTLGFPGLNVKQVRKALAAAGCDGLPSIQLSDECAYTHRDPLENSLSPRRRELMDDGSWEMSQDQFVHAYVYFMSKHDSAAARQLQKAFSAFDFSGDGSVSHAELRTVLERMATAPIAEDRIGQLLRELDPENTGTITLDEFSRWMAHTYASYLERPSLVPDSVLKIQPLHSHRLSRVLRGLKSGFEDGDGDVNDPWPK